MILLWLLDNTGNVWKSLDIQTPAENVLGPGKYTWNTFSEGIWMSRETNINLSMNMERYTEEDWSDSALVNIYTEKQLLQVLVIHF